MSDTDTRHTRSRDRPLPVSHGGKFTLDGDKMAATIESAHKNTSYLIGMTHHFTIKVEGDTYIQVGQDNEFSKVWKRVKLK